MGASLGEGKNLPGCPGYEHCIAAAFGTPLASVVANIVAALSGLCEVYYTDALALDVQRNTKLGAERQKKLMEAAEALARYMHVGVEELGRLAGRYARTVRRLGLGDVLIALSAHRLGAVLLTADWRQTMFYASIGGWLLRG